MHFDIRILASARERLFGASLLVMSVSTSTIEWTASASDDCPAYGSDCSEGCAVKTVWCGPSGLPFGAQADEYSRGVAYVGCVEMPPGGQTHGSIYVSRTLWAACSEECESYARRTTGQKGGEIIEGPTGMDRNWTCVAP
jgi:hypothetical protein